MEKLPVVLKEKSTKYGEFQTVFYPLFHEYLKKCCNMEQWPSSGWGAGFLNPGVLGSKPQGGCKVDSIFYLSQIDQMSTSNFRELCEK